MTAPGWYSEPDDPTKERYWDGQRWSSKPPQQPWRSELQERDAMLYGGAPAPPPPVPSAAAARDRRRMVIGGAVVTAIIVAVVIGVAVGGSGDDKGSGSGPQGGSHSGQDVTAWFPDVGAHLGAIQSDMTHIGTTAGNADEAGLLRACMKLKDDVRTFEADPDAPDPELRADLANAMDYYSTSATECIAGDYTSSGADADTGTAWIHKATARIDAIESGG